MTRINMKEHMNIPEEVKHKLSVGLWWNVDGHDIKIIAIDGTEAKVREAWIAEDTMEKVISTDAYDIVVDGDCECIQAKQSNYRLYATSAFNYEYEEDEVTNENEGITSSTSRDYSPSNPWDAPGMSIKDFI